MTPTVTLSLFQPRGSGTARHARRRRSVVVCRDGALFSDFVRRVISAVRARSGGEEAPVDRRTREEDHRRYLRRRGTEGAQTRARRDGHERRRHADQARAASRARGQRSLAQQPRGGSSAQRSRSPTAVAPSLARSIERPGAWRASSADGVVWCWLLRSHPMRGESAQRGRPWGGPCRVPRVTWTAGRERSTYGRWTISSWLIMTDGARPLPRRSFFLRRRRLRLVSSRVTSRLEIGEVMRHFDADHSGTVTYDEFITGVRGDMSALRRDMVDVSPSAGGALVSCRHRHAISSSRQAHPKLPHCIDRIRPSASKYAAWRGPNARTQSTSRS